MAETFEFAITATTKKKARKRRIRHERKWVVLRVLSVIFFILSISFLLVDELVIDDSEWELSFYATGLFAFFLVAGICARALITNMSSHWVQDRLNERIWIRDGYLYQFIQKAFSGGLNYRHTDETATVYMMDLSQIQNPRYDPKSGRIEFNVTGYGFDYADYQLGKLAQEWELPPTFTGIFYDYTEPSLYESLKSIGVEFEDKTIDFKIFDGRI